MRIELVCCGFNPASIKVSTDAPAAKLTTVNHKIVVESSDEPIRHLTVRRRSMYRSPLCYVNIINPVYFICQIKLHNRDVYFYDDDDLWADIVFDDDLSANVSVRLTKETAQHNDSFGTTYRIDQDNRKKCFTVHRHPMPQMQILRYKRVNILTQLFWSICIAVLGIRQTCVDRENMAVYLVALPLLLIYSGVKMYKYYAAKSIEQTGGKTY